MSKAISYPKLIQGIFLLLIFSGAVFSQPAEIPRHMEPYTWSSHSHNGQTGAQAAFTRASEETIRIPGAIWLRIYFEESELGDNSYITITSLKDGSTQHLNSKTLAQWENSSAYFNGEAVKLTLHVAPNDKDIVVRTRKVMVGEPSNPVSIQSQCGPTDDRSPSSDPAIGRFMPRGCTAWLIPSGTFVTAGHCEGSDVVHFNVPPSNSLGGTVAPPVKDQYKMVSGSGNFNLTGLGDDWATFRTHPNTQTGLTALQAQGASYTVVQNPNPQTIRITGFGVDFDQRNRSQTQQTHSGPDAGSSGNVSRYIVDTEGGNSGGPVIDAATGNAIGVHTNGGCARDGFNKGTSTLNSAFWSAVQGAMADADQPQTARNGKALKAKTTVSSDFSISQNYPNPFNPSTRIRYHLPETADVSLKVYDLLGKEVATLVQGTQSSGDHTVTFDASHLSSGIYYYRISTHKNNVMKKMILLK